jgi:outer membrane protein OmpA-like peptidoglycan-associated protein
LSFCLKIFKIFALLAAAAITAGCATTQVVLLPDQDGKVGSVEVSGRGTQTLDQAYQTTQTTHVAGILTPARQLDEAGVKTTFKEAMAAEPVKPANFVFYFTSGSADLTTASLRLIPKVMEAIRERNSTDIIVSGHTDTVGTDEYNKKLSLRRAKAVEKILISKGIYEEAIEVTYHGKGNPLIPTGPGVNEPRNRRVEVTVR